MDIGSNQNEDEYGEMNMDFKPSTPDPPNITDTSKTAPVINRNDRIEAAEIFFQDYYDHNHPDFPMIRETVKEERISLRSSINLFNKYKLTYSSVKYFSIVTVPEAEMRQQNDKETAEKSTPQVNNDNPINPKPLLQKKMLFKDKVVLPS